MDPTLFASFQDADGAERAFNDLLDLGVQPEDLSLLVNSYAAGGPPPGSSYDPAIANGLVNMEVGQPQIQEEGSYIHESQIGGGISTSTSDDDVSGVEEMDDGQRVAEDMIYPESGLSHGDQERHDVMEGANTGFFNTTEPDSRSIGAMESLEDDPAPSIEISAMQVPGLGRVLGDGVLATLATGAAVAATAAGRPAAEVSDYLVDAGVPAAEVDDLCEPFSRGGAVLAATIRPGDSEASGAEDILYRHNAALVRTYTDFPEPNG